METDAFDALTRDRAVRQQAVRESHLLFFHLYFPHYVRYPIADFQKDIFRITEDQSNQLACIVAFRGSGKSTLVTFSYSMWAILGTQQKKFVLIVCQTQAQARQQMANIKYELEHNALLHSDLGPFQEEGGGDTQWAISSLVFQNTGARIMIASMDQHIRGIKHHQYRPDLILLDDVEDMNSTKTMEGRNKLFEWFTREIVPLGDEGTRIVMVGNLLHEDSLMMRLRRMIDNKEMVGIYRWFPLLDKDGRCLWPGKFKTPEDIERLRLKVGNELAWRQEYLLEIVSDSTRVIHPEWIHRYTQLPPMNNDNRYRGAFIGMDLAISKAEEADYTAMVVARVYGWGDNTRIYVLPNPVNEKWDFPTALERAKQLSSTLDIGRKAPMYIEGNGYQRALAEMLQRMHYPASAPIVHADKRSRLAMISHLIKDGVVVFPDKGCEVLIAQIVGLGRENHDDLADALSLLVSEITATAAGYSPFPKLGPEYNKIEKGEEDDFAHLRPITAELGRELKRLHRMGRSGMF